MKTFIKRLRAAGLITASLLLAACNTSLPSVISNSTATGNLTSEAVKATAVSSGANSVPEALTAKATTHEATADLAWDSTAEVAISLSGDSITANHASVTIDGSQATITAAGVYRISGALANGQISVNTSDKDAVRLILNGVDIKNSSGAAIAVVKAEKTIITLADKTSNSVSDGANYVFPAPDVDEPNAAIFSAGDLTIDGAGSLAVQGNFNDGIASKDGLVIASGSITVNAADDGIRGKDYLVVHDGVITVTAKGDGLKSDNEEDAAKGYVAIEKGAFTITAGGDAIQAHTDVLLSNGSYTLTTGGGSSTRPAEDVSAKGIKAGANLTIDGGDYAINASDDAVHTNGSMTINAGQINITSGDDGLHADVALEVNGGTLNVAQSYEGVESGVITINNGDIRVTSSDDGINVANGVDGSGGRPGRETTTYSGGNYLYVNGGHIVVNAGGDGVDVNGAAEMTGGTLIVNGPIEMMNGALDYDAYFKISGGVVLASGSSGMAQAPGTGSTQASLLIYFTASQPAGTLVHIRTSGGEPVLTIAPGKDFQSLAVSSPKLVQGASYEILLGGSASGDAVDGLYGDATTVTGGAAYQSFTINGVATTVGSGGNQRMRGPRP